MIRQEIKHSKENKYYNIMNETDMSDWPMNPEELAHLRKVGQLKKIKD